MRERVIARRAQLENLNRTIVVQFHFAEAVRVDPFGPRQVLTGPPSLTDLQKKRSATMKLFLLKLLHLSTYYLHWLAIAPSRANELRQRVHLMNDGAQCPFAFTYQHSACSSAAKCWNDLTISPFQKPPATFAACDEVTHC